MQRENNVKMMLARAIITMMVVAWPMAGNAQVIDSTRVQSSSGATDFEFGKWHTKLRVLSAPLSGSTDWIEFEGTSLVTPILGGRANLVARC